ncbi:MAG: hypothetical protein IT269_03625, partial [Saprospiraceae bacterium]|nr:hypothetical protein [Saprospiraceae bacterium]
MKISRHILLMVLALFWSGQSFGENPFKPTQEFIRSLSRQFDTDAKGTTALYNKYGQIKVNTWSNNKVKIDVQIVVNARNQKEADKMFERINVNFTNAWGYVKAETFISETMYGGWWFNENSNCQDFKINYDIWMPENNQLDLKNKYGNSWVSKLNGKLLAEIKYGDLHAEIISNDADLNIAYGKADIQQTNNVTGQLSYSELTIG